MFEDYAKNQQEAFEILMGYFLAGQTIEYNNEIYSYPDFISLLDLLNLDDIIPVTSQLPEESRKLVRGYIIERCMGELGI